MTFNKWLRENYGKENHKYNDLLSDARGDKDYPWRKPYEAQISYLMRQGACAECLETLRDAYFDYLMECVDDA